MRLTTTQFARILLSLDRDEENAHDKADLAKNFFEYLKRNKQLHKAEAILKKLEQLDDEANHIVRLTVATARQLPEEQQRQVEASAARIFKVKTVLVTYKVDKHVLGGISLKSDTAIYDATVATRLRRLAQQLRGEG